MKNIMPQALQMSCQTARKLSIHEELHVVALASDFTSLSRAVNCKQA